MNININEKINIIHDYFYNNVLQSCYDINSIDINNIEKDDIKITNHKEIINNLLEQVIKYPLQYLFDIEDNIYLMRYDNQFNSLIKLSILNENKKTNDDLINYILSELVIKQKTKHILLPIINFDIKLLEIKNILNNIKLNDLFIKQCEDVESICSIKIRECFFNLQTLKDYLNNIDNYKLLLFQIIHTLAIIKNKYPDFNHNNLNLENIFVYINDKNNGKINKYIYNDVIYNVPYDNFEIKITNFENSIIFNDKNVFKNLLNNNLIKKEDDLITIVKHILDENKNLDFKTNNFLNILIQMKKINYNEILNNEYFNDYKEGTNNRKINDNETYNGARQLKIIKDKIKFKRELININGGGNIDTETSISSVNTYKRQLKSNIELESETNSVLGNQKNINFTRTLNGGGNTTSNPYDAVKNTPFRTNDQKRTETIQQLDKQPVKEPPVLLEQKLYDTSKKTDTKPKPNPAYIPIYDGTDGNVMAGYPMNNMMNPVYQEPMQKVYNISLANPMGNYTTINRVYEDILPGDPRTLNFNSIHDRINLIDFMRNIILDTGDGEEMNVTGGKNSLLSFIKMLELNPYTLNKNPYEDLPNNFMLYRGGYPIRYDQTKNNINISKSSTGINARMYNLTVGDMKAELINGNINRFNYDLWRDVAYYEYIKEKILKKKISPNFISIILYKIDTKSNIKWDEFNNIKNKDKTKDIFINLNNNNKIINTLHDIQELKINDETFLYKNNTLYDKTGRIVPESSPIGEILKSKLKEDIYVKKLGDKTKTAVVAKSIKTPVNVCVNTIEDDDINKLDLTRPTNNTFVLITEAPNTSLLYWATPVYENAGTVKKMISTGYHSIDVWEVIIFQLVNIFAVLQKNKIYFRNIDFVKNFFIKDLFVDNTNISYWIYQIDELDYYIPNYGYLLLFDSSYADIKNDIIPNKNNEKIYKSLLGYDDNIDKGYVDDLNTPLDIDNLILKQFKEIVNPNTFAKRLKDKGGLEPDEKILKLLNEINNNTNINISNYFYNHHFRKFLNNKVGTLLTRDEKEKITNNVPTYKKGKIIPFQKRYDEFEWVVYVDNFRLGGTNMVRILRKDSDNFKEEDVRISTCYDYQEKVIQETQNFVIFDEKHLLDKYIF
jgi:hypothetical protein